MWQVFSIAIIIYKLHCKGTIIIDCMQIILTSCYSFDQIMPTVIFNFVYWKWSWHNSNCVGTTVHNLVAIVLKHLQRRYVVIADKIAPMKRQTANVFQTPMYATIADRLVKRVVSHSAVIILLQCYNNVAFTNGPYIIF